MGKNLIALLQEASALQNGWISGETPRPFFRENILWFFQKFMTEILVESAPNLKWFFLDRKWTPPHFPPPFRSFSENSSIFAGRGVPYSNRKSAGTDQPCAFWYLFWSLDKTGLTVASHHCGCSLSSPRPPSSQHDFWREWWIHRVAPQPTLIQ